MAANSEEIILENLKSNNSKEVYNALLKVRKCYLQNRTKMQKLQKYSIMEVIIPFLEHPKFCSISLIIIADCCLELNSVHEFIKYNGIQSLIQIMKSAENDDQNRACRALGNLAKFDDGFKAIHAMKPVSRIINFLTDTTNSNFQQTAVRTLMILEKNPQTRELIVQENGVIHIAKLLHSSNVNLLVCSIKAVANLTRNCSTFHARQLIELQLHKIIIKLSSHFKKSIRNDALLTLKNLSMQKEIRSDLIKAGAVKLFTKILSKFDSHEMCCFAALALCSCLDHIHMWGHKGIDRAAGLKALLAVVQNKKFKDIHVHVISSLISASHESEVTDILLNLHVLQILIEILNNFIKKNKCKLKNSSLNPHIRYESDWLLRNQLRYEEPESSREIDSHLSEDDVTLSKPSVLFEKSEASNRRDNSYYHISPPSDYSSCSPIKMSASPEQFRKAPEIYCEIEVPTYSQIKRVMYSVPNVHEMLPQVTGWSPVVSYVTCSSTVVSSRSNSPTPEYGILDNLCFEEIAQYPSTADDIFLPLNSDNNLGEINNTSHTSSNLLSKENENLAQNFQTENGIHDAEDLDTEVEDDYSGMSDLSVDSPVRTSDFNISYFLDEIQSLNFNPCNDISAESVDHYVLSFILRLSFYLEEKPNSPLADKTCFSALIDYLCLIHNPCSEAETILLNLIKNRRCFEKLVVGGFISEIEDKMASSNYACSHRSDVKQTYINLMNIGSQVIDSDYVIYTFFHILASSDKNGQLHGICAISKFATDKKYLFRFLYDIKGLSLLCNFLFDNCMTTRRKAILALCKLYQSLTKGEKNENCCFLGTCRMKASVICSYKMVHHNVSFIVNNGLAILANREKLCVNSEYFSALLDGHFMESAVEAVSLPEISAENLSAIFHFLHGCASGYLCPYIKSIPFEVLLELLCYCDKYLLNNIKAIVEDRLCHFLYPTTVSKIYRESKINNSPALSKRSLTFALKINTVHREFLWSCFEELINLESNFNFLDDIESLFRSVF